MQSMLSAITADIPITEIGISPHVKGPPGKLGGLAALGKLANGSENADSESSEIGAPGKSAKTGFSVMLDALRDVKTRSDDGLSQKTIGTAEKRKTAGAAQSSTVEEQAAALDARNARRKASAERSAANEASRAKHPHTENDVADANMAVILASGDNLATPALQHRSLLGKTAAVTEAGMAQTARAAAAQTDDAKALGTASVGLKWGSAFAADVAGTVRTGKSAGRSVTSEHSIGETAVAASRSSTAAIHGNRKTAVADSETDRDAAAVADGAANAKRKEKRKDRLDVQVVDQRTEKTAETSRAEAPAADRTAARNEYDLTVRLNDAKAESAIGSEKNAAVPSSFADQLARELRENTQADIVRQATIMMKDGGEGLIRLQLEPESLGSVKIRLELADNKIRGQILVESDEALRAFEQELRSLEQAFVDGGFDGAGLELAVSTQTGSDRGHDRPDSGVAPYLMARSGADDYEAAVPDAAAAYGWNDAGAINLFA